MTGRQPVAANRSPHLVRLLLTITLVTGLVDAFSYLALGRVFVANMVILHDRQSDPRRSEQAAGSSGGQGFELEQEPLAIEAAGEPGEAAVRADHSVAGNDHGEGIAADRRCDGTQPVGPPDSVGYL
jgi:hypothetical protein